MLFSISPIFQRIEIIQSIILTAMGTAFMQFPINIHVIALSSTNGQTIITQHYHDAIF